VCQTLKSDPATLHIPVVLLTGTFEPFDRDRAMAAGCDAIVTKPFEARELINTVEDLIKRAQAMAAVPAEAGMVDHGIPDGVPALDFTGPGFDKLAPPPQPSASAPEDGIDLTASSLNKSNPPVPQLAPPELREPVAPEAPPSYDFGGKEPPGFGEPPAVKVTPPEPFVPVAPAEPEPAAGGEFEPEQPPAAAPMIEKTAPVETAAVFKPMEPPVAPRRDRAMDEGPTQSFPVQPSPPTPREVPAAPPAQAAIPAASGSLTDEQVDRIARRVVELATPQLERIAWEVIPDMAEMVVRKRIAELEAAAEEES
jgi:hypothetical protein